MPRTGYETTILAIGIGAMGDGYLPEETVVEVLTEALDQGINYVDAAPNYKNAQRFAGPVIAARRADIFLVSKIEAQTRDGTWAQIESTLVELQTDVLDLLHIHNLGDFHLDSLDAPNGTLTAMREAKEQGLVRHLGASGHHRPVRFPELLRRHEDVDVVMVPLNMVDRHTYVFESVVAPAVLEAGAALVAMKPLGGVTGWRYAPGLGKLAKPELYRSAMRYALGLEGVSTVVSGLSSVEEVLQAVEVARDFTPLTAEELAELEEPTRQLAAQWGLHYGPTE